MLKLTLAKNSLHVFLPKGFRGREPKVFNKKIIYKIVKLCNLWIKIMNICYSEDRKLKVVKL